MTKSVATRAVFLMAAAAMASSAAAQCVPLTLEYRQNHYPEADGWGDCPEGGRLGQQQTCTLSLTGGSCDPRDPDLRRR